jgi:PEP-CTERM motif-containing protein
MVNTQGPFSTYNLTTAIGPITGVAFVTLNTAFDTSGGNLTFTSAEVASTFTATLTSSVPEPTSLVLLGSGLFARVAMRRVRKA